MDVFKMTLLLNTRKSQHQGQHTTLLVSLSHISGKQQDSKCQNNIKNKQFSDNASNY